MAPATRHPWILLLAASLAGLAIGAEAPSAAPPPVTAEVFTASAADSVRIGSEPSADARRMLEQFAWPPSTFEVRCGPAEGHGDRLVRFPSPAPSGDALNDVVVLEWYQVPDREGRAAGGPATLVLDVLDGGMVVSRGIAHAFAGSGIHAFVMHMPGYGPRRRADTESDDDHVEQRMHQAVCDARRARDAIAVLPGVEAGRIGIQGTSLGGFVTALAAAVDGAFDPVFIILAGGDLYGMLEYRFRTEPYVRRRLEDAGFGEQELRRVTWRFEPTRIAHRLNPRRTWLFSAVDDQIVPLPGALALAEAARLDGQHHVLMTGNHLTCAVNLPWVGAQMIQIIREASGQGSGVTATDPPAPR